MLGYLSVYTSVMANEQEASMKMDTLYQTVCLKGFGLYFNILYLFRNSMCKILFISLKFTRKKCMWKLSLTFVIFFYFLTMSNYQWIYGVSDKTQLLIFFYRLHKMLQIFKMFKNQSKQTKINKGHKKTGVWSTRLKWNFCVSLMASFNCLYNYCKIGQ